MSTKPVWFVTGASQGFGLAIVNTLLGKGWKVAAATRSIKRLSDNVQIKTDDFFPIEVDITKDEEVKLCVGQIMKKFGTIDVVVNNAGYAHKGAFESITDASIRKEFDVNFFGLLNVTRNVLPIMRKNRKGLIFNVSSISGMRGTVLNSIYVASKHAVNGFSESLRLEVSDFNIKVVTVMPGWIRTNFLESSSLKKTEINIDDYQEKSKKLFKYLDERNHKQEGDPVLCAEVLIKVSLMKDPPLNLFLGEDAIIAAEEKLDQIKNDIKDHRDLMSSTFFK
ncbi:hypothetical protein M9Y10_004292 [Tritrichomonas musculus]|uniref:Oxidoreductase, short chain dehydrogenase/reductase family protein n=1 Tax=Tritrichomonas musculus TaxID=1915356 RepID=A0ABR2JRM0_9EUKA